MSEGLWARRDAALALWVLTEAVALIWRSGIIKPEELMLKYNFHSHNLLLLQLGYCPTGLFLTAASVFVSERKWNCCAFLPPLIPTVSGESRRGWQRQIDGLTSPLFSALSPTCVGLFLISLACVCLCVAEDLGHPSQSDLCLNLLSSCILASLVPLSTPMKLQNKSCKRASWHDILEKISSRR